MRVSVLLAALAAFVVNGSPVTKNGGLTCHDFLLPVNVSAENRKLSSNLKLADLQFPSALNGFLSNSATTVISGTYNVAGRYCEPVVRVTSRVNTLQVLVHGITYTKEYWSGLAPPGTKPGQEQYSWVDYAAKQGYPTLSLDRLCNGLSSHLDGLIECQLPIEADAVASAVQAARQGSIPGVNRGFSKIILIGHSYGSLLANYMSIKYPGAADALVMTGWSSLLPIGLSALIFQPLFLPAIIAKPESSIIDPAYLTETDKYGARNIFYYGNYNESTFEYDFAHRQTLTLGEAITALLGAAKAPAYNGPLFVLNGKEDNIFCPIDPVASAAGLPGDCEKAGVAPEAKKLYPGASSFGYYFIPNTGHCLNLHDTAITAFKIAHDWLTAQGL